MRFVWTKPSFLRYLRAQFPYFFVIFCSIFFRIIFFNIFHVFLGPEGRFLIPSGSLWGGLGHHFDVILATSLLPGVQRVLQVPKCTVWDPFWRLFGMLLRPFCVILGSILGTLFVCMMLCEFRVSKIVFYVTLQGIPLFLERSFRIVLLFSTLLF